jgi:hypothetical protein
LMSLIFRRNRATKQSFTTIFTLIWGGGQNGPYLWMKSQLWATRDLIYETRATDVISAPGSIVLRIVLVLRSSTAELLFVRFFTARTEEFIKRTRSIAENKISMELNQARRSMYDKQKKRRTQVLQSGGLRSTNRQTKPLGYQISIKVN